MATNYVERGYDSYERENKLRDYSIAVGNVQHVEDLRDRFDLQKGSSHKNIMHMLDALDTAEEFNTQTNMNMVFDGALADFLEFVNQTNKDQYKYLEDEIDMLKRISSGLAKLKMEGILNALEKEGILERDEVDAMASHHILDDAAEDLTTATSKNILLARTNSDLKAAIHSIRNTFDDNAYRFNFEGNPVIEKLQDLGVVESVRSRGVIREDEGYNDGRSTDFRRSTESNFNRGRTDRGRDFNRNYSRRDEGGYSGGRTPQRQYQPRQSYQDNRRYNDRNVRSDYGGRSAGSGIQLNLSGDRGRPGRNEQPVRSSAGGRSSRAPRKSGFSSNYNTPRRDYSRRDEGGYSRRDTQYDRGGYDRGYDRGHDRRRSFSLNDFGGGTRQPRQSRDTRFYPDNSGGRNRSPRPSTGTFSILGFDQDERGNRSLHINVDDDFVS